MPAGWKKDRIYLLLKQKILRGELAPKTRLPNELDFCRELQVAKVTLRSALARLESEGLVERFRGKGTFVCGESADRLIQIIVRQNFGIQFPHHYIIPGITAAANEFGYAADICFAEYLLDLGTAKAADYLKRKNICGTLLLESDFLGHEPEVEIFHRLGLPVLLVHARMNDHISTGFSSLVPDVRRSWRDGLKHLSESGYENVRLLMHPEDSRSWNASEYPALFRELNLNTKGTLCYTALLDPESIRTAVKTMLRENPDTQAVYCYSDFYAMQVMKVLASMNLRVPDDIAVMGYCGYPGDVMHDPPLSTVDLGYMNIGRRAVELLPQSPEGKAVRNLSPYQVIGRKSTENPAQLKILSSGR